MHTVIRVIATHSSNNNLQLSNWMDVTFHREMPRVTALLRAFPDKPTHQV